MPAQLSEDAVAYLMQHGVPTNPENINRAMAFLSSNPELRPSYSSAGDNVDREPSLRSATGNSDIMPREVASEELPAPGGARKQAYRDGGVVGERQMRLTGDEEKPSKPKASAPVPGKKPEAAATEVDDGTRMIGDVPTRVAAFDKTGNTQPAQEAAPEQKGWLDTLFETVGLSALAPKAAKATQQAAQNPQLPAPEAQKALPKQNEPLKLMAEDRKALPGNGVIAQGQGEQPKSLPKPNGTTDAMQISNQAKAQQQFERAVKAGDTKTANELLTTMRQWLDADTLNALRSKVEAMGRVATGRR